MTGDFRAGGMDTNLPHACKYDNLDQYSDIKHLTRVLSTLARRHRKPSIGLCRPTMFVYLSANRDGWWPEGLAFLGGFVSKLTRAGTESHS